MDIRSVKKIKRFVSALLAAVLALFLCCPVTASDACTEAAAREAALYLQEAVPSPTLGYPGGEWTVIALARSGFDLPQSYWESYRDAVVSSVTELGGVLSEKKYTEYSRVILALTAIGADPTDVGGYNLLTPLGDYDGVLYQGVNGPAWALIALDSGDYAMPENSEAEIQATREMYVSYILSRQMANGGWSLTGTGGGSGSADPDITAIMLAALAKYTGSTEVSAAVERGLDCLSEMQEANGGYESWGTANCESTAQVIIALCELGIPLDDPRFVKNGNTLLDGLMLYASDGGFCHTADGDIEVMSTEQALCALSAIQRSEAGEQSLYSMTDTEISVTDSADFGLPGKSVDVRQTKISNPGTTFSDIENHENRDDIETLASRGIINGMGGGLFDPDGTMTRAQFAAIVVRVLGLPLDKSVSAAFDDVTPGSWYYNYVNLAADYGLVNGRGGGLFDPEGSITRQEAAVLITRAAGLCGMDTELSEAEIENALSVTDDGGEVSDWARAGVAFCLESGIMDAEERITEPRRDILRCEMAQMLRSLLDSAELL